MVNTFTNSNIIIDYLDKKYIFININTAIMKLIAFV